MNSKVFNSNFIRIFISSFLLWTGNQVIMVVLPLFLLNSGYEASVLGIATSLSAFAAMFARPVSGFISDKKSKRLVIIFGLSIMIFGMLGFNILPFATAIIAIRFVQGFGISAATTAQMAVATDVLPISRIKKGISYFAIAQTLAGAVGPSLGLALIFGSNYLHVWLGGAAMFAAALILASTFTYEKDRDRNAPVTERQQPVKGILRYFEKRAILPSMVQMILTIASAGVLVFLPAYTTQIGIADIGLFYILQACTMFAANIIVGNFIGRIRNLLYLLLPAILCVGGSILALFLTTGASLFFIAAILYGIGAGISTAVISALTMSSANPDRRGAASATFLCSIDIGYCIGSLVCGIIAGSIGYRSLYGVLIILPVLAVIMIVFVFGFNNKKHNGKKQNDI